MGYMKKYYYKINRNIESIYQIGSGEGNAQNYMKNSIQENTHAQSNAFDRMRIGDTIIIKDTNGESQVDNKTYTGVLCEKTNFQGLIRLNVGEKNRDNVYVEQKNFISKLESEKRDRYNSILKELVVIEPSSSFLINSQIERSTNRCKIKDQVQFEAKKPIVDNKKQITPGNPQPPSTQLPATQPPAVGIKKK